ncbi:MAG: hypothetical protein AMXMBFR64_62350 [Myxococcales bacterium]
MSRGIRGFRAVLSSILCWVGFVQCSGDGARSVVPASEQGSAGTPDGLSSPVDGVNVADDGAAKAQDAVQEAGSIGEDGASVRSNDISRVGSGVPLSDVSETVLGCLIAEGAKTCSAGYGPGGTVFVPTVLREIEGGRLHLGGMIAIGGLFVAPKNGPACPCSGMFPDVPPGGFWFGDFDPGQGAFTSVGACMVPHADVDFLITEVETRKYLFGKLQPHRVSPVDPGVQALVTVLDGVVWRAGESTIVDDHLRRALAREHTWEGPGGEDVYFDMPVATCMFSQATLAKSGCFQNPGTHEYTVIPDNLDSVVEMVTPSGTYRTVKSVLGHKTYTFFAALPGQSVVAVRSWISRGSAIWDGQVFALNIPLGGVGTWSSGDPQAPELLLATWGNVGSVAGSGSCSLEVTVTEAGERLVGSFSAKLCSDGGGGATPVSGTFDVGYSLCP